MDASAAAQQFHDDGFVIVRGLLAPAEVARISDEVAEYIRTIAPALPPGEVYYEDTPGAPVKALHGMDRHAAFFAELRGHERFLEIVSAIWPGAAVELGAISYFGKAARAGSVTPPHQDNAFQLLDPPLGLELTLALDESTPDNGALTCRRGSHRLGLLPHRPSGVLGFSRTLIHDVDDAAYPEVRLCMKPGDLALHHVLTIHRSDANRTDRPRRQLGLAYRSALAKRDEAAAAKYQADIAALHATAHQK
jgi:phytanoyl-CoA hydroxylase